MKKIIILLTGLFILTACAKLSGPEYTANKFFDLLEEGKTKEAKLYSTSGASTIIEMIFTGDDMEDTSFEVKDCITNGNKSICTLVVTNLIDGEEKSLDLSLVKENGNWLVDLNKDMMGDKDKALEGMKNIGDLLEQ